MTAVAEEITGVEAGTTERTKPDPDVTPPKPKAKAETKGGPLLTLTGTKLAEHVHNLWKGQNQRWARRLAEWRMNDRRRNGEKNLYISKKADRDQYDVLTPPGMGMMPIPVYNKADRLCQRLGSQQFADDYQPDVEPAGDTDDAKDAAQLAERALEDLDSEGNLNDTELQREAFDLGHSGGSGYILYYPDPYAGGRHPVTLEAAPEAQSVADATRDPMTGLPWPSALRMRYVTEDQMLTDNPAEAATDWRPRLDGCAYHARHVRMLPWDAKTIWDADGVLIAEYRPWGQLKRMYPNLASYTEEQVRELCKERPQGWHELLPWRDGKPHDPGTPKEGTFDDWLVAHLRVWITECGEYPDGAHAAVLGKDLIPTEKAEPWIGQDDAGRFKLDLPVSQTRLWRKAGDPHGLATMDILGDSSEARAAIMAMYFDYLDKISRRKMFVPTNSTLSGKEMLLDHLDVIPVNPGGQPFYEDLPPLPKEVQETFAHLTTEMDDAVFLQETAQGLESDNAESGRAKLAVISQVHASLSDMRKNVHQAHIRSWRIKLQLMRAKYTKPQILSWAGEEGSFKVKRWQGSDLSGVKDVKVRPGTGTMLPPLQKIEQAIAFQQSGLLQLPDVMDTVGSAIGAVTGVRDNPHLLRVKRQIAQWEQGPKTPDPPPQPQMGPQLVPGPAGPVPMLGPDGQPAMAPQLGPDGQPLTIQPPHPEGMAIFQPVPVDNQPDVAGIRIRELGRTMAGVKYSQFSPAWQMALNAAYDQAKMALAPPPPQPGPGGPSQQPLPTPPPPPSTPPPLNQAEQGMAA